MSTINEEINQSENFDISDIKKIDISSVKKQLQFVYSKKAEAIFSSPLDKVLFGFPRKNAIEFTVILIRRLPFNVTPTLFVDLALKIIKFMRDGYDSNGIPVCSTNKGCHPMVANNLLYEDLPKIVEAIFPLGLAEAVKKICLDLKQKDLIFS